MSSVTKDIEAENVFSAALNVSNESFNLSLSGTWVATVFVQRSFDGGTTWLDVESFTANGQHVGDEPESVRYRVGVKTDGFSSGKVVARLGTRG
jgi:hypothetical protein